MLILLFAGICVLIAVYFIFKKFIVEEFHIKGLHDPILIELRDDITTFLLQDKIWDGYLESLNDRAKEICDSCSISKHDDTFTLDKKDIHLCMLDEKDEYYNKNQLIYVLLHELGHVICPEIGHTQLYDDIFQQLKKEASIFGIYDINYKPISNYCNIKRVYNV